MGIDKTDEKRRKLFLEIASDLFTYDIEKGDAAVDSEIKSSIDVEAKIQKEMDTLIAIIKKRAGSKLDKKDLEQAVKPGSRQFRDPQEYTAYCIGNVAYLLLTSSLKD